MSRAGTLAALHLDPSTGEPVGAWTSVDDRAYVQGARRAMTLGVAVMDDKKPGYGWDGWCGDLALRWPATTWWETVPHEGEAAYRVLSRARARYLLELRNQGV